MTGYRGRFAPSPSGMLHIGSLLTAIGSWCDARSRNGKWLLRIDDLDPPRIKKGALDSILKTLDRLGLFWDEDIVYQSSRAEAYSDALNSLHKFQKTYSCICSRKDIIRNSKFLGVDGPVYIGTCRDIITKVKPAASRIRVDQNSINFIDVLHGLVEANVSTEVGDFVLQRADKVFSYHLANVVDDNFMGITDVVRGADLLPSTSKQVCIIKSLGLAQPNYLHLPIAINNKGKKLSKKNHDGSVDLEKPSIVIWEILKLLNQDPPLELNGCHLNDILRWATYNWSRETLPSVKTIKVDYPLNDSHLNPS